MELQQIKQLIEKEVWIDKDNSPVISMENCRLDFKQTYLFFGFTKSGNVKLGEIYSWGQNKKEWKNRIAKVEEYEDKIRVSVDGGNYSLRIMKVKNV